MNMSKGFLQGGTAYKIALGVLFLIIGASIFAPFLATCNPFQPDMMIRLQGPSMEHFFGTDALGRDMFSRILYGGRASMVLSLCAAALSMALGLVLGSIAAYKGGKIDASITLLTNIMQGIPGTCFMIAVVGILGTGIESLLIALIITGWAGFSRIVRAEVLNNLGESYIEGLRCIGCSGIYLVTRHVWPNIFRKLMIFFTMRLGRGVLSIAGLSFLGLGVQPPTPDWSVMISDALMFYRSSPHLIIVPGMCIFALIYSLNIIGDELRDRFDVGLGEIRGEK